MIDLFNASEQELEEYFNRIWDAEPEPEWKKSLNTLKHKVENDFQAEWSKKRFKWLFTKRRKKKLKAKIWRRHQGPIFDTLQDLIDELWTQTFTTKISDYFEQFVDVKNIACSTPDWCTPDKPEFVLHTSDRILRNAIADEKIKKENIK